MEESVTRELNGKDSSASKNLKFSWKRKALDIIRIVFAYLFSSFGVLILACIIIFVISQGSSVMSWRFLTSDYNPKTTTVSCPEETSAGSFGDPHLDKVFFSSRWGIGLEDSKDASKVDIVIVSYMDSSSPFKRLTDQTDGTYMSVDLGTCLDSGILADDSGSFFFAFAKDGAEKMAGDFEKAKSCSSLTLITQGGGIRGSLISTFYMIFFALLFSLPLGILAAVYFTQYARDSRFNRAIRGLIDAAGGIPSIIYGLVGALVFIPIVNFFSQSRGGSIISGAMTLALMLLPTIISTTEEALKTIPASYTSSSLALGASKTQTVFKVVLPNALMGVLTAVLLAIGRIIGESAALIYAMGTAIKDNIILTGSSATLALHIWSLMGQENPNIPAAAGVAFIIIIVDFTLSLTVKIVGTQFAKRFKGGK